MHYYIAPGVCADWYTGMTLAPRNGGLSAMRVADFDALFSAVGERLRLSVQGNAALLPTAVLECAEALGQLHQMLIQDRKDRNTQTFGVLCEHGTNSTNGTANCRVGPQLRLP